MSLSKNDIEQLQALKEKNEEHGNAHGFATMEKTAPQVLSVEVGKVLKSPQKRILHVPRGDNPSEALCGRPRHAGDWGVPRPRTAILGQYDWCGQCRYYYTPEGER